MALSGNGLRPPHRDRGGGPNEVKYTTVSIARSELRAPRRGVITVSVLRHGTRDDGMRDDGMRGDGMRDDGMRGDGMRDDGMRDDGMRDDGMRDDGTRGDGTRGTSGTGRCGARFRMKRRPGW